MRYIRRNALSGAGAAIALAMMLAPAHAGPGAGAAQPAVAARQMVSGPNQRVAVMSGLLTAPSSAPPATIAASFLASRPSVLGGANPASLTLASEVAFHRGHALRYQQSFKGLPVLGGTTVVRVDDAGQVRWASSGARAIANSLSIVPALSPREALAHAGRVAGYDHSYTNSLELASTAQLAIYAMPGVSEPRLVYWIEMPFNPQYMQTIRAIVDAETGYVYRAENKVLTGNLPTCSPGTKRAYVYDSNPIESPDLSCVSLESVVQPGSSTLRNADVATGNCVDNNACRALEGLPLPISLHWCDDVPDARTNGSDDFTDYVFASNTEVEDPFSEVQMFYHVNRVYQVARELGGFVDLATRPLNAVVNFRLPFDISMNLDLGSLLEQACLSGDTYTGGLALHPFDNAAFIPAGGLAGYPATNSIVFGQGSTIDFAYDGDVVYHEFGHALMNTVSPNLTMGFMDQYGFNSTPGGMHEGYADLMTVFVTDDPEVGEYAGTGFGLTEIRNANNTATCPADLVGEVHEDALPLTGAIWEARQAIGTTAAGKRSFDEAVFAAQQTFTENDDFQSAAMKTLIEIESALGAGAATTAEGIFAARGLDGCNNRVFEANGTRKRLLFVGGSQQAGSSGAVPAPVQLRYDLPSGADSLTLNITRSVLLAAGGLGGGEPTLELAVKQGSQILWTESNGTASGDYTSAVPVNVTDMATGARSATISGPLQPGSYYLQLQATGGSIALIDIALTHPGAGDVDAGPVEPDAGAGTPDAGVTPDAGSTGGGEEDGGCGCEVGGAERTGHRGGLILGLLGLALAVVIRRRRA